MFSDQVKIFVVAVLALQLASGAQWMLSSNAYAVNPPVPPEAVTPEVMAALQQLEQCSRLAECPVGNDNAYGDVATSNPCSISESNREILNRYFRANISLNPRTEDTLGGMVFSRGLTGLGMVGLSGVLIWLTLSSDQPIAPELRARRLGFSVVLGGFGLFGMSHTRGAGLPGTSFQSDAMMRALEHAGYSPNEIGLLLREQNRRAVRSWLGALGDRIRSRLNGSGVTPAAERSTRPARARHLRVVARNGRFCVPPAELDAIAADVEASASTADTAAAPSPEVDPNQERHALPQLGSSAHRRVIRDGRHVSRGSMPAAVDGSAALSAAPALVPTPAAGAAASESLVPALTTH